MTLLKQSNAPVCVLEVLMKSLTVMQNMRDMPNMSRKVADYATSFTGDKMLLIVDYAQQVAC